MSTIAIVIALGALLLPQISHAADLILPPENASGYDALCRDDWTKRGILNNQMYSYCMDQMHTGYVDLSEAADKYKDTMDKNTLRRIVWMTGFLIVGYVIFTIATV
jgi:hypothetical protein